MKGILGESGPRPACLPVASVLKKKKKEGGVPPADKESGAAIGAGLHPQICWCLLYDQEGKLCNFGWSLRPFLQQRAGAQALTSEVTQLLQS